MAENPITVNLPADLPEDWAENQIVAPEGQSAGLTRQHGYNYLMEQVNNAQTAAIQIGAAFSELAPGGFGLGTVAVNIPDLNDATKNGWYMNGAGGEAVHAPDNVPGWLVLVCAYADEIVFQTAYRYGSDEGLISARRSHHYLFGGWQPWEWINPPTLLGVEYRTVERYNSKPVYVKAINFGTLPNNTNKSVEHGVADMGVCFELFGNSYPNSDPSTGTNLIGDSRVADFYRAGTVIYIGSNVNFSSYSAIVVMKYTKTTD